MRVVDGMHRLSAAELRGESEIQAQFFDGDEDEAFLLAVQANIAHGLPLTIGERRAAAARIIHAHPEMSDRSIAAVAGLAAKTVAALRNSIDDCLQPTTRIGRDGRVRPLNAAEGRRLAGRIFVDQPGASLRKVAMKAGISVGTARDVRDRILRGEDPVLPRQRAKSPNGAVVTASRNGAAAPRRPVAVDHVTVLEQLRQDPSLRYSESGRSLLRWLSQRAIGNEDWESFSNQVPPHCAIVIARIARGFALSWNDLADALDQCVRDCA
jgi:hypothetical protein